MTYKAISRKIVRFISTILIYSWWQWPRVLRRGPAVACLLELPVRMSWYGCFSLVSVVCCRIEVSVTGWSLVQRSPIEYDVSNWVWSWSLGNGETLAHGGLLHHWWWWWWWWELNCHLFVTDRSPIIITYSVFWQGLASPKTKINHRVMVVTEF